MQRMKFELNKNEEKQKRKQQAAEVVQQVEQQQTQDEAPTSPNQQQQQQQQPIQSEIRNQLQQKRSYQSSDNEQQDADQTSNNNNKPKRNPFCSRCRNHGKSAAVKGHKRYCEYRECQCMGCKLVEDRQAVSAKQIKLRRYQKQDEECGRRIEITPPVLNSDPTALLAKSLINSVPEPKNIHLQQQQQVTVAAAVAAQKQLAASSNHHQLHNHHHHLRDLSGIHSASLAAAAAVAASSSSVTPSTIHHQHQHQQNYHHHQNSATTPVRLHEHSLNLNHSQPQHNSALSTALHLFHYPDSVLSAAAAAVVGINPKPPVATSIANSTSAASNATSSLPNTDSNPSPLPNTRDQIAIVEELFEHSGRLAVYALLDQHRFDVKKVRDLLESKRATFNHMLDLKSKYFPSKSACESNNSSELSIGHTDRRIVRECQPKGGANIGKSSDDKLNALSLSSTAALTSSNATTMPTTSPLYTFGNTHNTNYLANGNEVNYNPSVHRHSFNNNNNNNLTTITASPNHLPITSAQNLFWPDFKLATSEHGPMIHPHHLLPHFMQHHPFMTHHMKHTQPKVSPISTITHSSESSSSTIL